MNSYKPRLSHRCPVRRSLSFEERLQATLRSGANQSNFSLAQAARQMHLSQRSLQRELHARETTFRIELLRIRTELAKELILSGENIEGILPRVGYKRREHFERAFRRSCGQTPHRWKNQSLSRKD